MPVTLSQKDCAEPASHLQIPRTRQNFIGFQRFHRGRIGRVLVHVHHPWHRIARCVNRPAQEAFGCGGIAFRSEQKVDRLPGGIQRSIHILILAFYVDIGLVDPIALVRRLQMRSAAFVQLRCIGLHPAPNAAGIHLDTTFGQQLGDVLLGERIPEVPAHAQNDHFS